MKNMLIALFHYDITSKQIYCLDAQNHGHKRGYSMFGMMKNRLKVFSNKEMNYTFKYKAKCDTGKLFHSN